MAVAEPRYSNASRRTRSTRSEMSKRVHVGLRGRRVVVDQHHVTGATGERLDAECAGSAEEIADIGAGDVAENREERLAGAVRRRPDSRPAAALSGGGRRSSPATTLTPRCPRPARRRSEAARRRGAGRAPDRRASRSACRARSPRGERRPGAARPREARAARKRGSPLWSVPRISPSPRSERSTSASLKPSRSVAIASSRRRAVSEAGSPKRMQYDSCSPRPTRPRSWWSWESP